MTEVRRLRIEAAVNLICDALDKELAETRTAIAVMQSRIDQLEEATGNDSWATLEDRINDLEREVECLDTVQESDMERYVDTAIEDFAVSMANQEHVQESFREVITQYFAENPMVMRPMDKPTALGAHLDVSNLLSK